MLFAVRGWAFQGSGVAVRVSTIHVYVWFDHYSVNIDITIYVEFVFVVFGVWWRVPTGSFRVCPALSGRFVVTHTSASDPFCFVLFYFVVFVATAITLTPFCLLSRDLTLLEQYFPFFCELVASRALTTMLVSCCGVRQLFTLPGHERTPPVDVTGLVVKKENTLF